MLHIGSATIETITDLDPFALPMETLFPGRPVEELRGHAMDLAPHHLDFDASNILLGVHSHLLRLEGRNILIDTCIGEHKPRPRRPDDWNQRVNSGYLEKLAERGLKPEDIDMVFCTHLHADHIGWNTILVDGRWVPTFPNARYLIGRTEFAHWQKTEETQPGQHNHGAFVDSIKPILDAGLIDLVDDGFEILEGLTVKALPGHSPGQIGLCLCHGGQKAIFCADAVHSLVQVFKPDWTSRFCADVDAAIATRLAVFEDSITDGTILIPAHLRHFSALRIHRHGDGFRPEIIL